LPGPGASQFLSTDSYSIGNSEFPDESRRLEHGDFLANLQGVQKPGNVPELGGCWARADTTEVHLDPAIQAQAFLPVLRPRLGIPVVLSSQPAIPPPAVPASHGTPGLAVAWRHGGATVWVPWAPTPTWGQQAPAKPPPSHQRATSKPATSLRRHRRKVPGTRHLGPPEQSRLGQRAKQPPPRRWEGEVSEKGALGAFHDTPVRAGQDRAFWMLTF